MCAATPSRIRWLRNLAALAACLPLAARAEAPVRFFFQSEGQDICVQARAGEVEALVLAGGRVQRRARGPASPEFAAALRALEWPRGAAPRGTVARGEIVADDFFFLSHPRGHAAGPAPSTPRGPEALRAAALALASALPAAEAGGLYILVFPATAPGPQEDRIALRTVAPGSPLHAALAAPGFPLRVADAAGQAALPRHSVFTLETAPGKYFLVSYSEGPPFSLRAWLAP